MIETIRCAGTAVHRFARSVHLPFRTAMNNRNGICTSFFFPHDNTWYERVVVVVGRCDDDDDDVATPLNDRLENDEGADGTIPCF